ncbi:GDSL-type esterase/lipase family protein [Bacillus alkalicellulosilyticus]|uniref:GDSL-type esterase/lipase family protein n=1 Tax=Alkalihalobacterium alkalicellulosilyticum TaxID=1912214 RepID=UPI001483578C|nr:GDSL-type esterase/lipase family protein [Bacillus alkalicellulosilyticus]
MFSKGNMKKLKSLLFMSLSINALLILGAFIMIYKVGGIWNFYDQVIERTPSQDFSKHFIQRKDIFESKVHEEVDIIFAGDSITDYGEVNEWFPRQVVLNRGVRGDDSKGLLYRIDDITRHNAEKIYIMIGINDLLRSVSKKNYVNNMREIIERIQEDSPNSQIFIQSILPINHVSYKLNTTPEEIQELNVILEKLTVEYGVNYIDLYSKMSDDKNLLNERFTNDGLHLLGEGYEVWETAIHNSN